MYIFVSILLIKHEQQSHKAWIRSNTQIWVNVSPSGLVMQIPNNLPIFQIYVVVQFCEI